MTGAMYAAVSGLRSHMTALNVIGENVSNVNTLGYKSARYTFNEALYTTTRSGSNGTTQQGGVNPAQIGYGSSIGTIDIDMSTKTYVPTGLMMDCMIDGDGMFILGDKTNSNGIKTGEQLQSMTLSRLGNFNIDAEGWVVDGNGSVVYGFLCTGYNEAEKKYEYSTTLTALRVPYCTNAIREGKDANGKPVKYVETNVYYPSEAKAAGDGIAEGDTLDGSKPQGKPGTGTTGADAAYQLTYIPPDMVENLRKDKELGLDATTNETALLDALNKAATLTDAATGTDIARHNAYLKLAGQAQTEATRVNLSACNIDASGRITGMTQDDQTVVVGYVALAKVDNPNGLTHVDGRYYKALGGAGAVHLTSVGGALSYVPEYDVQVDQDGTETRTLKAGYTSNIAVESSGDTKLVNGGLESSGTDLATEISNMIIIQRGYQANTRIVTVTDSMLEELVNMKR